MLRTLQTLDADLAKVVTENIEESDKQMNFRFPTCLDAVWNIISRTNKYIMKQPGYLPKRMVTNIFDMVISLIY